MYECIALLFLVDKYLLCPTTDERSRKQTYFVLYRPTRVIPTPDPLLSPPKKTIKRNDEDKSSPVKKKQKIITVAEDVKNSAQMVESASDDTPAIIHISAGPARPICTVSLEKENLITQRLSRLFAVQGDGQITLSALITSLRENGVDETEISNSDIDIVLEYLADLNKILVDDTSGADKEIYEI